MITIITIIELEISAVSLLFSCPESFVKIDVCDFRQSPISLKQRFFVSPCSGRWYLESVREKKKWNIEIRWLKIDDIDDTVLWYLQICFYFLYWMSSRLLLVLALFSNKLLWLCCWLTMGHPYWSCVVLN